MKSEPLGYPVFMKSGLEVGDVLAQRAQRTQRFFWGGESF